MRTTASARERRTAQAFRAASSEAVRGTVVSYAPGGREEAAGHEAATRSVIAEKLAILKGYEYAGEYDAAEKYARALYFVPAETLGCEAARELGIDDEDDLFGGVVPHEFVATKSITHPLPSPWARAPEGWSDAFPRAVHDAVLPGYTAFSMEDGKLAGERLLKHGPLRVKPSIAVGGRGQSVVTSAAALQAALAELDPESVARCGVAVEVNLLDVTTYSVGQVRVGELLATYFGTQKLTIDGHGAEVYGGSVLTVARGGFEQLLSLDMDDAMRDAIERSQAYDAAARRYFPGFFASRCNYDIARGRDADGRMLCGVLEQSWRIGGASSAEVAALEIFRADASVNAVRAECTEVYGESIEPPSDAAIYFRGIDPRVGFITKHTTAEPYADA